MVYVPNAVISNRQDNIMDKEENKVEIGNTITIHYILTAKDLEFLNKSQKIAVIVPNCPVGSSCVLYLIPSKVPIGVPERPLEA